MRTVSISIQADVQKREGLSQKDVDHREKLLEEIEKANPSMPPENVRYDLRRIGANVSGGIFALAGAFAALAFAKVYKAAKNRKVT